MELLSLFEGRLIIETGDITKKKVDAIVNAANSTLMGGGGVDGAIHRTGGRSIYEECMNIRKQTYPDGLPTGEALYTGAGDLFADYIIHTVGPLWRGGDKGEEELLHKAYINSLAIAKKLGITSIAFPAISTGVYGYPKEKAAHIVFTAIKEFIEKNNSPEKVYLVFFNKRDADIFIEITH